MSSIKVLISRIRERNPDCYSRHWELACLSRDRGADQMSVKALDKADALAIKAVKELQKAKQIAVKFLGGDHTMTADIQTAIEMLGGDAWA